MDMVNLDIFECCTKGIFLSSSYFAENISQFALLAQYIGGVNLPPPL